jgi:hypothetical protein
MHSPSLPLLPIVYHSHHGLFIRDVVQTSRASFIIRDPTNSNTNAHKAIEAAHRRNLGRLERAAKATEDYEVKLGVTARWIPSDKEWQEAAEKLHKRDYQRALDNVERLLVSRIFELSKMNLSYTGAFCDTISMEFMQLLFTGYKMRRHIAKALKSRSEAVKTAINRFNAASSRLQPPGPAISWEEAVDYTFLAEFDLLRDARADIRQKLWAQPAGRLAMDKYFKTQRAHEEIARLNVEIRRLLTYICDEESELRQKEREYSSSPALSLQISRYRQDRERFNKRHIQQIVKLARLPGFSGDLSVGVPVKGWGVRAEGASSKLHGAEEERRDDEGTESAEEGDEASSEDEASDIEALEASDAALAVLEMSQR